jgi:hypothetical protein
MPQLLATWPCGSVPPSHRALSCEGEDSSQCLSAAGQDPKKVLTSKQAAEIGWTIAAVYSFSAFLEPDAKTGERVWGLSVCQTCLLIPPHTRNGGRDKIIGTCGVALARRVVNAGVTVLGKLTASRMNIRLPSDLQTSSAANCQRKSCW